MVSFLAMCAGHISIFFIFIFGLSSFTVSKVMGHPTTSTGSFRGVILSASASRNRNSLSVVALQGNIIGGFVWVVSFSMSIILILNMVSFLTYCCFLAYWTWSSSFAGFGGVMSIIPTMVFGDSNSAIPMCSNFDLKTMAFVSFFRCFIAALMTSVFWVGSILGNSAVCVSCSVLNSMALVIVFIRLFPRVLISYTVNPVGDWASMYFVV